MAVKVRLRVGENEIEVEGETAYVDKQIADFIERFGSAATEPETKDLARTIATKAERKKSWSPAELVRMKHPKSGTAKLLVLAKYLEDQGASDFRLQDINRVADQAKIKDIHPTYLSMAVKQGLLRSSSRGRYSLTLSGEDAVNSMSSARSDE